MLKRRTPAENLQRTIIGVLVGFGFSGALAYGVGKDIWLGFASSTWSQTEGVIKTRNVEHSLTNQGRKDFSINVLYTYTVDGKQYENKRIRFPESWDSGDAAYEKKQTDHYAPGSKHTVYYYPSNPAQSCLIKGPSYFYAFVLGGLGVLFFLVGTICLLSIPFALKRLSTG